LSAETMENLMNDSDRFPASEVRQNKITKQWVIYAPARAKRPNQFVDRVSVTKEVYDAGCPFCPGNEDRLPSILLEMPSPGGATWQTRVVPNRYPAVTTKGDSARYARGIYVAMSGYGEHEVIIESPSHHGQIAEMSPQEVEVVIETYHRRFTDVTRGHENMLVMIFRNHGRRAGTSLLHPHSQLIMTDVVPRYIRWKEDESQRHFDHWGRCVYCEVLAFEAENRARLVMENQCFLAFVPFAADVPFEVWIMPKRHQAVFGMISDQEKTDFAAILHGVLKKLYQKLQDPDYNYVIISSPACQAGEPQMHWYLQLRPRLSTPAGFEIGSGININPSIPEDDAAFLTRDGH
jgi:UDPglucose--hexose-1-phosphate uridylyltransferase